MNTKYRATVSCWGIWTLQERPSTEGRQRKNYRISRQFYCSCFWIISVGFFWVLFLFSGNVAVKAHIFVSNLHAITLLRLIYDSWGWHVFWCMCCVLLTFDRNDLHLILKITSWMMKKHWLWNGIKELITMTHSIKRPISFELSPITTILILWQAILASVCYSCGLIPRTYGEKRAKQFFIDNCLYLSEYLSVGSQRIPK